MTEPMTQTPAEDEQQPEGADPTPAPATATPSEGQDVSVDWESRYKGNMTVDFKLLTRTLEDFDVTVTVRRATLGDESKRMAALFAEGDTALITDIASVEIWITLVECNIVGPDDEPLLDPGMDYETFGANLTAV